MALPRRRGPMSAAQKAALKKAQEISARKRRGTGKPEPISLRKRATAADYRAAGNKSLAARTNDPKKAAQMRDFGVGSARTKRGNDVRTPAQRAQAVRGSSRPQPQTASSTSSSGSFKLGTADPGTMGVSQILKERKELIAKRNGEGLSKEEAARLVAIQAESALRHQNRKAGKGTGPTKVALGKTADKPKAAPKKAAPKGEFPAKEIAQHKEQIANIYGKIHNTGRSAKVSVDLDGNISIDYSETDMKGRVTRAKLIANALRRAGYENAYVNGDKITASIGPDTPRPRAISQRPDNPDQKDVKKLRADYIKARDSGMSDAYVNKAKRLLDIALERQKKDSPDRFDASGKLTTDKTAIKDLRPKDRAEVVNIRESLRSLSLQWIQRDNVISELDSVKNIGDLVEAAQSVEWYLHEYNAQSKLKPIAEFDKLFAALKKYSDRYRYGKGN